MKEECDGTLLDWHTSSLLNPMPSAKQVTSSEPFLHLFSELNLHSQPSLESFLYYSFQQTGFYVLLDSMLQIIGNLWLVISKQFDSLTGNDHIFIKLDIAGLICVPVYGGGLQVWWMQMVGRWVYKCGGCKWWVDGSTSVVDVVDANGG